VNDYDIIVVGARCAGSPTAMLLARRGYRVLLVDRATFPSDTISTLLINPPGVAALQRWDLLDDVAGSGCPPITTYSFDFGPFVIAGAPHPSGGTSTAYAPRRTVLDKILVEAAAAAGAEVREGFSVDEVLIDDGTVVGIAGHDAGGTAVVERARVLVGADGWNSVVARAVGAERYNAVPVRQTAFYAFWSGLPVSGLVTILRGDRGIAALPTNDGQTLVLTGCPYAQTRDFRTDVAANYLAAIDRAPEFAEHVRLATRESRIFAGGVPNVFRTPYGPGWALVGDAGYIKDPITAQGITDAFMSAERCAAALDDVFDRGRPYDEALADYQHHRDIHALPIYELTTQLATLEPPPPEMQQLFAAVAGNQAAMDAFVSVMAGTLSPTEFFDPANVAAIVAEAA
jgi:2-polyprenyl-6-methoxyphenol hydroxylase-like FAD-dependent oxidoreductase